MGDDRWTDAALAATWMLYRSVLVNRDLSVEVKLLNWWQIYSSTLTYRFWVVTERITLSHGQGLGVEPPFLLIERSQVRRSTGRRTGGGARERLGVYQSGDGWRLLSLLL